MRTRKEQIADLSCSIFNQHDNIDECLALARKYIIEAERRAEQRVRAEIAKRHTWFYMVDDPESGHADMADMLCETTPYEIVETSEAADIRIFFAFQDEDREIHEFSTREEAERAVTKAIDAAREVG